MRLILTFLILILISSTLWSQNSIEQENQQGIYGEIVNVPFFVIPVPKGFGLGYEYHFNKKAIKTNIRLGLEFKKLDGNYYNLSSEYNFLFGKTKHFLETGGIFQLLSKDLQIKVLENDFINKPGEGDQWIQPHIYIGMTKLF